MVAYTARLTVMNPDSLLRPGMKADLGGFHAAYPYCGASKLRCIFSTSWSMLKLDGR